MNKKKPSIKDLLIQFYKQHPNQELSHGPVVDWVEIKYMKLYGKKPRDTWRSIRNLHEEGILIKVSKGVYKYDPKLVDNKKEHHNFTIEQKKIILERDGYKCVICGRGRKEGVELHVDHIKPRYLGGLSIIENGQTLCAQHNFIKKTMKQTETGKRMFIRLYELAVKEENQALVNFCESILQTYEEYGVNGHIVWKKDHE